MDYETIRLEVEEGVAARLRYKSLGEDLLDIAAERALARLHGRKLGTRECPVLFRADVAPSLLRSLDFRSPESLSFRQEIASLFLRVAHSENTKTRSCWRKPRFYFRRSPYESKLSTRPLENKIPRHSPGCFCAYL